MEVRKSESAEAGNKVRELRYRILHLHTLEGTPRRESKANLFLTNSINDRLCDFESEATSIFNTSTPFVIALVACVLGELINEVALESKSVMLIANLGNGRTLAA